MLRLQLVSVFGVDRVVFPCDFLEGTILGNGLGYDVGTLIVCLLCMGLGCTWDPVHELRFAIAW